MRQPVVSSDSVAQDQIRAFVERIERLEEEKRAIGDDIREVKAEAKASGFSVPVLNEIIRLRRKDAADRMEHEALLELYMQALGMAVAPRDYDDEDDTPPRRSALSGPVVPSVKTETTKGEIAPEIDRLKSEPLTNPAAPIPPSTVGGPTEAQPLSAAEEQAHSSDAGSSAPIQPETANETQPERSEALSQIEGGPIAKAANQSTAARMDVPRPVAEQSPVAGEGLIPSEQRDAVAGTQAPPVDASLRNPQTSQVPGTVVIETTPPLSGMHRHEYLACFSEHWGPAFADIKDDIREHGVREPIQRQGNTILDGWARYTAARELGIEYLVMEYAGDDPLTDIIAWNLESRRPHLVERQAIAKKLIKLAPERADEITDLLDLNQMREAAE